MRTNNRVFGLIRKFEGLRLKAYQDSGGKWTIGYGHTKDVTPLMECTLHQAEQWLYEDILEAEERVESLLQVPVTDNEFSALVSLVFNIGTSAFATSTLLRLLNEGNKEDAASEFTHWNHVGGKVDKGLTRRRGIEKELFSKKDVHFVVIRGAGLLN